MRIIFFLILSIPISIIGQNYFIDFNENGEELLLNWDFNTHNIDCKNGSSLFYYKNTSSKNIFIKATPFCTWNANNGALDGDINFTIIRAN